MKMNGVIVLFSLLLLAIYAEDSLPDFTKLRVKELKRLLDERGVECNGCVEKEHIVARLKETFHLPVLTEEQKKDKATEGTEGADGEEPWKKKFIPNDGTKKDKFNPADIQKLIDELKKSGKGFENAKMYSPDDLKNFGYDEWNSNKDNKEL